MKRYKVWQDGQIVRTPYPGNYAGITTQKIFGTLDCESGKRAKKENRIFFRFWEDAVKAGYRPCRNCQPLDCFRRTRCDHMPFGLTGGYALTLKRLRVRIRVSCTLCGKCLGFAKLMKNGLLRWKDGVVIAIDAGTLKALQK